MVTVRLSDEEQNILATLKVDGATTISDKLRSLVRGADSARRAHDHYPSAIELAEGLLKETQTAVKLAEHEAGVHSDFLERFLTWLPLALASALSHTDAIRIEGETALRKIENALFEQHARHVESVLQLGLTADRGCYSSDVYERNIEKSLQLAELVQGQIIQSARSVS